MALVKGFRPPRGDETAPKVVIAMPAYNAAATLARTVADIPDEIADRLILVDDASPDNTVELARELGIEVHVHPENRGYGGNQKTCYSIALQGEADVIVMLHPDYQYEPRAVPLLIAPILAGDADMTFGSRFAGLGDPRGGGMPIERYVGNRVTTMLENLILGSRFSEMHSGMRAYSRRCLLSLPFRRYSDDFIFDSELLVDAVTRGLRVVEVPIPTRYTEESSSIGIRSSLSYVVGSLSYCARTVLSHGRKRHRTPRGRRYSARYVPRGATLADPADCLLCGRRQPHLAYSEGAFVECAVCGFVLSPESHWLPDLGASASDSGLLESVFSTIGGYFVPGNRLLMLGVSTRGRDQLGASAAWSLVDRATGTRAAGSSEDRVDALFLGALNHACDLGGLEGLHSLINPGGVLALAVPCLHTSRPNRRLPYQVRPAALDRALRDAGFRLVEWTRLPRSAVGTRRGDMALAVARAEELRRRGVRKGKFAEPTG